jgi:hypothetical protein
VRPALGVLVLLAAAAWCAGWPRRRSRARLIHRIFRNVDELLGVRRFENDRRASRRHWWVVLGGRAVADAFYPATQLGGAMALPATRRQARYVHVRWPPRPWPEPWRKHDLREVTLGPWTSEAHVHTPSFFDQLERKLAQALSLEYRDGMFQRAVDWPADRVTLTLAVAAPVPDNLTAAEDLADA